MLITSRIICENKQRHKNTTCLFNGGSFDVGCDRRIRFRGIIEEIGQLAQRQWRGRAHY